MAIFDDAPFMKKSNPNEFKFTAINKEFLEKYCEEVDFAIPPQSNISARGAENIIKGCFHIEKDNGAPYWAIGEDHNTLFF
jgi:hypothetical protein